MRRRKPRKRIQASASARGYGYSHQKLLAALKAAFIPGQPCLQTVDGQVCGRPMYAHQKLVLGHTDDRTGYIGLVHQACNQRDAAIRGNRMRATATGTRKTGMMTAAQSRAW